MGGSPHTPIGRDPRSPSTGLYAYVPPSAPPQVTINPSISNQISVKAELNGHEIVAAISSEVKTLVNNLIGAMGGGFGGASHGDSGFDAQHDPIMPDHVGGVGHN